jgi:hypothetical protein
MRHAAIALAALAAFAATLAAAERIALPQATTPDRAPEHGIWPSVRGSLEAGADGMALFPSRSGAAIFEAATPNQAQPAESFRILRSTESGDERAAAERTASGLTKVCPKFPAKVTERAGALIVERESTDCIQPGYRYTMSRYMKGADGMYQVVYLARGVTPPEDVLEAWRDRIARLRLVP